MSPEGWVSDPPREHVQSRCHGVSPMGGFPPFSDRPKTRSFDRRDPKTPLHRVLSRPRNLTRSKRGGKTRIYQAGQWDWEKVEFKDICIYTCIYKNSLGPFQCAPQLGQRLNHTHIYIYIFYILPYIIYIYILPYNIYIYIYYTCHGLPRPWLSWSRICQGLLEHTGFAWPCEDNSPRLCGDLLVDEIVKKRLSCAKMSHVQDWCTWFHIFVDIFQR